jgi:ribonuclease HI
MTSNAVFMTPYHAGRRSPTRPDQDAERTDPVSTAEPVARPAPPRHRRDVRSGGDDPDLDDVVARERRLLDPAVRRSRDAAGRLLDPDFREFGAFGRVWDRDSILAAMAGEDAPPPEVDEVAATRVGTDTVLVTYRARRPGRTTLRSSLWRRRDDGDWRLCFHQGTVVRS